MKHIALVLLLCMAFWSGACGKKGDPRAPELVSPKTIDNLRAQTSPSGVTLTWSRPSQSIDGRDLKDLSSFVIFRKELSPGCLECPVPYRQLTTVFVEDNEKFIKQRQYRFVDQEVRPQAVYRYRVSSQLSDGSLGGPSNEVEVKRGP
jgi:hypothetical protein